MDILTIIQQSGRHHNLGHTSNIMSAKLTLTLNILLCLAPSHLSVVSYISHIALQS